RGVRAALLLDRERDRVGAVEARGGRPLLVAVDHAADVADADGRAGFRAQDDVLDLGDGLELAFRPQRDRLTRARHAATGHVEVFRAELLGDDADRQAERLEPAGVEVHLDFDPGRLEALGLPVSVVAEKLGAENLDVPGGRMTRAGQTISLRTKGEFQAVSEIENVILRSEAGSTVRVRDV